MRQDNIKIRHRHITEIKKFCNKEGFLFFFFRVRNNSSDFTVLTFASNSVTLCVLYAVSFFLIYV